MAKSNRKKEELKLKYVRFWRDVDKVDRSRDYIFLDLGVTIAHLHPIIHGSSGGFLLYRLMLFFSLYYHEIWKSVDLQVVS